MELAAPFQNHSPTSKEAARAIAGQLGRMEIEVLNLIATAQAAGGNGLTDAELIAAFGSQSARPRRIFLVAAGKLRDSGGTRKTASGRAAVVWCIC